jgi:FixJ family two-component response regulator
LYSGRGRFFFITQPSVAAIRPLIAVIEADATDRRTLCSLLSTLDVEVRDFDSAESYLAAPGKAPGCLITEVALPGMSGLDLLRLLRAAGMSPPIILLGEESDVRAAVTAMREGAIDFIEKPHVDMAILRRVAYLLDHGAAVVKH